MAYPPPPGLPAKPPSSVSAPARPGFKPAYSSAPSSYSAPSRPQPYATASHPQPLGAVSYAASAAQDGHYGPSSFSAYPASGGGGSGSTNSAMSQMPMSYAQSHHQHQHQQSYGLQSYGAPPQIRNPFPAPTAGSSEGDDYESEMAAQIAQWQSAYMPREPAKDKNGNIIPSMDPPKVEAPVVLEATNPDKKKTVVREGGGKKWTDDTLLDWDPTHLRLFVGNLAGETTDESLLKAFSRWKSVQMARVIRDKRTTKSKGYGFISFSDADDFFQAAKEMDGKYIQSHPVRITKAKTELKATNVKDKGKGGKKNKHKAKQGSDAGQRYEPSLGPHGGGVTKPGQKTKNGLRLLG